MLRDRSSTQLRMRALVVSSEAQAGSTDAVF